MNGWVLHSVVAAGADAYDVCLRSGDDERTFRFVAQTLRIGGEPLLSFNADGFEEETLYSRAGAKAVLQVVAAFHEAVAEPVAFAPAGQPPPRH